ncbi:GDP-L-fucose synthase [Prochlorococcus sp. MIT 1300]|uniref:GDP-L-fucose synthase family protein n=1 Tax=Prochlorococcus sp. MIT 1300 TaxID=3096218 RepID=UPI002A75737D|nr:GDP-L-fucose synthase [Prochlorococcus sp. MIT 1300]
MKSYLIQKEDLIYIAGSSGMAGNAISKALNKAGYTNQISTNRKQLDLTNNEKVREWFSYHEPDIVIIAAAKVGGIYANNTYPADFLLQNLKIQNNIIENAWLAGVRRLLFLGSSCIYPKFAKQPIKEEELLKGSLEVTNQWYAIAKIAGIKLCDALRLQEGFDAISLMPTNLYGPGDNYHSKNSHVLPALIRRFHEEKINQSREVICWGTGKPLREFLYVEDLGEACVFALKQWSPNAKDAPLDNDGEPLSFLNVGTGKDASIKEIAMKVAEVVGFEGTICWDHTKADGTPKKQLDISRLSKLGWQSKITLDQGIKMAYEDFKQALERGNLRA